MSNLIPVSRKEQYLSKIDGMTNKSPDKTYTKEEYFFSEILGEALHKPVLETRYEMYLAKIAGREIGIPYPETRLERFLAKAAGMDISVPTPITREEMYWSTYSPFYLSNASGEPPFSYNSVTGTLNNYRIYGQTVDGESVGDRTANLFDKTKFIQTNIVAWYDHVLIDDPYTISTILPCNPNTKYTISKIVTNRFAIWGCTDYPRKDAYCNKRIISDHDSSSLTFKTGNDDNYLLIMLFYQRQPTDPTIEDVKGSLMFNYGNALPYEPYGYKVPVTVTNDNNSQTTNLYLPEQIRKVGDEAEYIDYGEQKFVKKFYKITLNFDDMNNDETFPGWSGGTAVVEYCNKIRSLAIDNPDSYTPFQYSSISNFKANFNVSSNRSILYLGASFIIGHTQSELKEIYAGQSITFILKIPDTDLDVTLPALPTLPGTNVLSVGTEVQPSHVFVEFYKEREYG